MDAFLSKKTSTFLVHHRTLHVFSSFAVKTRSAKSRTSSLLEAHICWPAELSVAWWSQPEEKRPLVRELTGAVDEHYSLIAYLCSNLSTAKAWGICVLDFCPEIKDHDRCTRSLYFVPSNCIFSLGRINNLDKHHAAAKKEYHKIRRRSSSSCI